MSTTLISDNKIIRKLHNPEENGERAVTDHPLTDVFIQIFRCSTMAGLTKNNIIPYITTIIWSLAAMVDPILANNIMSAYPWVMNTNQYSQYKVKCRVETRNLVEFHLGNDIDHGKVTKRVKLVDFLSTSRYQGDAWKH